MELSALSLFGRVNRIARNTYQERRKVLELTSAITANIIVTS